MVREPRMWINCHAPREVLLDVQLSSCAGPTPSPLSRTFPYAVVCSRPLKLRDILLSESATLMPQSTGNARRHLSAPIPWPSPGRAHSVGSTNGTHARQMRSHFDHGFHTSFLIIVLVYRTTRGGDMRPGAIRHQTSRIYPTLGKTPP